MRRESFWTPHTDATDVLFTLEVWYAYKVDLNDQKTEIIPAQKAASK